MSTLIRCGKAEVMRRPLKTAYTRLLCLRGPLDAHCLSTWLLPGQSVTEAGVKKTLHYSRAYDPKQPGLQLFMTPAELSATDSIVTTCVYNSKNMTQDTPWGLDLQCLATIYYIYPRQRSPSVDRASTRSVRPSFPLYWPFPFPEGCPSPPSFLSDAVWLLPTFCVAAPGSTLPSNLAQYKDKDVALCTVGKERSFAASTPAESLNLVNGVKTNGFTLRPSRYATSRGLRQVDEHRANLIEREREGVSPGRERAERR